MPGTFLNYPFDAEIFQYLWGNVKDTTTEALLSSGAMVQDANIANLIANGSDTYTVPFYNDLTGDVVNYDGQTDITSTETSGDSASGIVFGRAKGFTAKDFIADFNSGADPMALIANRVGKYWLKQDQKELINILNGIFGITGSDDITKAWLEHSTNIASTGASVEDENKLDETSIAYAIQKASGDMKDQFSLAIMHSMVATNLGAKDLLEYRKYTDAMGIQRTIGVADINGMTVIIDDGVPTQASTSATGKLEYTTYLFGNGALGTANAPVAHPAEPDRNPSKNGGEETLYTRRRKTIHPYGFSFAKPTSGYTSSPTFAQLGNKANWSVKTAPKLIPMAKIVSNG